MSKGKYIEEFSRITSAHSAPFKSATKTLEYFNKSIIRTLRKNFESNRRLEENNDAGFKEWRK